MGREPWYTVVWMVALLGPILGTSELRSASDERAEEADAAPVEMGPLVGSESPGGSDLDEPGTSILPLDVRLVGLRDLGELRRLDPLYRLNQPDSLLAPYSALRSGLTAALPGLRSRRPAFVARSGDRLVGFAHFQPVGLDRRWHLLALGASVGVYDAEQVWDALLTTGVRNAGLRGVKRLYARIPHGAPLGSTLRRHGWSPYATETIFVGRAAAAGPAPSSVRAQEASDTWAIHQLYIASVPRAVQDAEAFTSHWWDVRARRGAPTGVSAAGWLVEEGHRVLAYARSLSGGGAHVLDLVYHSERREVLPDLLTAALANLPERPSRRVYCAVRSYQEEAASALEDRGFAPTLEQELVVKYTTARIRLPASDGVSFHVEVRDKLPQRVPSFLQGRPGDDPAT